jgi:hypothetical protein
MQTDHIVGDGLFDLDNSRIHGADVLEVAEDKGLVDVKPARNDIPGVLLAELVKPDGWTRQKSEPRGNLAPRGCALRGGGKGPHTRPDGAC